ncbi:DUF4426 domain-containing protein [Sediminicurvatus halobius]|uniref:DUF4426 domain-containing protein n=1 Tax=Sediminicurvatus halobius TaxID=2182432 RepID=A0A2U2MZ32_9GAMM|nr:DUF4426 domain-containing protein [Spiribacter halobius]PWG61974.1 DUF4426 domain-containing protein [Spiribacter halobius]UEX78380.1 DUF4426 domain-containing protein [Spiribacter halobius]
MPPLRLLFGLTLMFLALPAAAQQADRFGDYEVHYNAMPTRLLNAEVAASYNILRSRTRGLLMLTVMRGGDAVPARIEALARDADDRLQEVDMREVRQSAWVSYIGTFPVEDEQALRFEVEVTPEGGEAGPFRIGFRQRFFAGE